MKFTLDGARTIVSLNLEEAREMGKYDHRTSEYWPTLIGERLWFLNMLNNIEAEPIKHGRWLPVTNGRGGFECSVCTNYAPSYQDGVEWHSRFCPTCGARMDLDEVEE
jgi:hypothetical protein